MLLVSEWSLKSPIHNAAIASVLRALAGSLFHKFGFLYGLPTYIDNGDLITVNLNLRRCQFLGVSSSGDLTHSVPFTGYPLNFSRWHRQNCCIS